MDTTLDSSDVESRSRNVRSNKTGSWNLLESNSSESDSNTDRKKKGGGQGQGEGRDKGKAQGKMRRNKENRNDGQHESKRKGGGKASRETGRLRERNVSQSLKTASDSDSALPSTSHRKFHMETKAEDRIKNVGSDSDSGSGSSEDEDSDGNGSNTSNNNNEDNEEIMKGSSKKFRSHGKKHLRKNKNSPRHWFSSKACHNFEQNKMMHKLVLLSGKDKMMWARRAFFMSTERIFPGFIRNYGYNTCRSRDPTGLKLRSSIPLKIALLAHSYFVPFWFFGFLFTQEYATASLKPLHSYVLTCLAYVSMGTDVLRLYAGFTSNTKDDMQMLALYWMGTLILQTPMMVFIFVTHCFSTQLLPLNVSMDILLAAILSLEIWFGFWQLKGLVSSEINLLHMARQINEMSLLKDRESKYQPRIVNCPEKGPYLDWSAGSGSSSEDSDENSNRHDSEDSDSSANASANETGSKSEASGSDNGSQSASSGKTSAKNKAGKSSKNFKKDHGRKSMISRGGIQKKKKEKALKKNKSKKK